ncbi:glycosyltransferase family 2 protein [Piscinibacter sp. XHJ-5]|uniref:glycosyltransferase family 2 protein n=1 Tax=Piscinibacter sp. XHJ-5 TaxID=3037797 RepID=UPI00245344E6|nr:glycosyltransferase family 2 protein [Piscinibacter sp. XHJ-5]
MSAVLLGLATALTAVVLLLLVPVMVLFVQVVLAAGDRPAADLPARRPRLAVLVPAHNEAAGIAASLATVTAQLDPGDRVLVVADNCSDDTAQVAAAAGAQVAVRTDARLRGKGYALAFGVERLADDPPEVVLIIDADCAVQRGAVDRLARECLAQQRPVQALYLMQSPPGAGLRTRIAEFAWVVKNQVRPLGWYRAGWPCQLMGTGMAFPWRLIRSAPLASGHLVEDLQLGLDLAAAGSPPVFAPEACVTSVFPEQAAGLAAQRTRWEHGHLGVIATQAPRLLGLALTRGRVGLGAMVLDLCVPPLAALVLLLSGALALGALLALLGGHAVPLALAAAGVALLSVAVLLAWAGHARRIVSLRELLGVPLYVLGKLPIYARLFGHRQVEWVRTKRDDKPR